MAPAERSSILTLPSDFGKDEMNLAELPFSLVADKAPSDSKFERKTRVYDDYRKRWIEGSFQIQGTGEFGLPTANDSRVQFELIQLNEQQNQFKSNRVNFKTRDLLKALGWPDDGPGYNRLRESLLRAKTVSYICNNCWKDHRGRVVTTKAFSLIDVVEMNDSREYKNQESLFPSYITWNSVFFESLQAGYLRTTHRESWRKLKNDVALRIYRYLSNQALRGEREFVYDLRFFAYNVVGLTGNYQGCAHIARALRTGFKKLEEHGFLLPMQDKERYAKKGKNWQMRLVLTDAALDSLKVVQRDAASIGMVGSPVLDQAPSVQGDIDHNHPLLEALTARGVIARKAGELIRQHDSEYIEAKIELLDWMQEKQPAKVKNPAAYLVKAIEDDYAPPKGFETRAQREAKEQAVEEARCQQAEVARRKAEEDAREKAVQKAIDDYWNELSRDEQTQLVDAMFQTLDEEKRDDYRKMQLDSLKSMFVRTHRIEYIRKLLEQQGRLPS